MVLVAAFYHFFDFADFRAHQQPLLSLMKSQGIKGSILIADEGFNGTISGTQPAVHAVLERLKHIGGAFEHKESFFEKQPFGKAKVRLKKELISLGEAAFVRHPRFVRGSKAAERDGSGSPLKAGMTVGDYVEPKDWNALISDPDTIVLDTRNSYETYLGTFARAIDPNTRNFKELPAFVRKTLQDKKHQKIATFCTGGIRCEKFTAWMKAEGFENVYHLKGGILKYLEDIPKEESLWNGECYVFDERVAVGHGLAPSQTASSCTACGHTLKPEDCKHPSHLSGKQCRFCAAPAD